MRSLLKPSSSLSSLHFTPTKSSFSSSIFSGDGAALLRRLFTVIYQQQRSSDAVLHSHLSPLLAAVPRDLHHELFLQTCSRFPFSHRAVHRLFLHLSGHLSFSHSPQTAARHLQVLASARNVDLLWSTTLSLPPPLLSHPQVLLAAFRGLAESDQLSKSLHLFSLLPSTDITTLNQLLMELSARRMVPAAKKLAFLVRKHHSCVQFNATTYHILITGLCRAGEHAEAAKLWNAMLSDGIHSKVETYDEIIVTLFKRNQFADAVAVFNSLRQERFHELGIETYRTVVTWLSKKGRLGWVMAILPEMVKKGIGADDDATWGAVLYGMLVRGKLREARKAYLSIPNPDRSVYHGVIKGLFHLRRWSEATAVFQEMVERGCEPTMHTYVMLLQGQMGRRGRKWAGFESLFIGGMMKAGVVTPATVKYVERVVWGSVEVPRFDYNEFLRLFSTEEGAAMFVALGRRMIDVGMPDLGYVLATFGERMATRDRRRIAMARSREKIKSMED